MSRRAGRGSVGDSLDLRAGELVEVRSEEEILGTLDSRGTLDSLPFMPEMLQFCGQRFRVRKRADKTCDTIDWGLLRRMRNASHLEELRCDGSAHGGCQAGCLLFWKDAWLRRVGDTAPIHAAGDEARNASETRDTDRDSCTVRDLHSVARTVVDGEEVFTCQATELKRATSPLPWWEPTQYIRDIRSRNAKARSVLSSIVVGFFNKLQAANIRAFPRVKFVHGGRPYPFLLGTSDGSEAPSTLGLQPGDLVEVKSKDEIFRSLDPRDRTRGLRFDGEMLPYCGRSGRVLRRVERIIDEKTGRMVSINSDCIIIDGFVCRGTYHRSCPRAIYPYWRESWLRRVPDPASDSQRSTPA
jgi:hypothetical protein